MEIKKSEVQKTIEEWGDLLTAFPNNYGINLCAIKGLYLYLVTINIVISVII